jgi:hypothetical protein
MWADVLLPEILSYWPTVLTLTFQNANDMVLKPPFNPIKDEVGRFIDRFSKFLFQSTIGHFRQTFADFFQSAEFIYIVF